MEAVLFTKLFQQRSPAEVSDVTADLGFDGVDLLIRSGCTADPGDAAAIGRAAEHVRSAGLSVPMATTDLTDPAQGQAERVLGACAQAGIEMVRLGYWKYDPAESRYHRALDRARRQLAELVAIADRHGVRLAVQLHGGSIHSSGALTRTMLEGHSPQQLVGYPDPGNQAVQEGRVDWRLTFDLLEPWLGCVGVKNGGWSAADPTPVGQRSWRSTWLGLADGMVPWPEIIAHLTGSGYAGLLSVHSHYRLPYERVLDQTRTDLHFLRRLLAEAEPQAAFAADPTTTGV